MQAQRIGGRYDGPARQVVVVLPPHLIERASTRAIARVEGGKGARLRALRARPAATR